MDRVRLKCVVKMLKNTLEVIQLVGDSIKVKHVLEMLKITFRSKNSIILMIFPKISSSCWVFLFSTLLTFLTLKMLVGWGGVILTPHLVVFPKRYFLERVKPCFFIAINIIISLAFSENFSEIPQVFHTIRGFSPSI